MSPCWTDRPDCAADKLEVLHWGLHFQGTFVDGRGVDSCRVLDTWKRTLRHLRDTKKRYMSYQGASFAAWFSITWSGTLINPYPQLPQPSLKPKLMRSACSSHHHPALSISVSRPSRTRTLWVWDLGFRAWH